MGFDLVNFRFDCNTLTHWAALNYSYSELLWITAVLWISVRTQRNVFFCCFFKSKEILLPPYLTSPECDKEKRSFAPLVLFFQCFIYITALLMITVNVYLKKMGCWTPWPPGGYCATYRHVNDTGVKWKQFMFVFTYFRPESNLSTTTTTKKATKKITILS